MKGPFLSSLSADELLLVERAGWEVLDIAAGECSQPVPAMASASVYATRELQGATTALTDGPRRSIRRMQDRVAELGGDGAVGVRLSSGGDFRATGTAVRRRGERRHPRRGAPFTSHLSGQDTWALIAAGRRPLGIVLGVSVQSIAWERRPPTEIVELPKLTAGVYGAREQAMSRMQQQAAGLHARGVVGVAVTMKVLPGPVVHFEALGTAIGAPRDGAPGTVALGVSMSDARGR